MATETTNYKLVKPAQSDYYNVDVQNGNMDIIDGKLKDNADAIATTADKVATLESESDDIQTQLDGKQPTIKGGATSILDSNLTASRALVSDGNGKVAVSPITSTELNYLDNATGNIQTQINGKAPTSHASTGTSYGIGNASNYGHVKLTDILDGSLASQGIAASPKAVQDALTALFNGNVKTNESGYVVLNGGMKIVWKRQTFQLSRVGTITLPIAFSSASSYVPIISYQGGSNANGTIFITQINAGDIMFQSTETTGVACLIAIGW